MTPLKDYLNSMPDEAAREAFAQRCGTTIGHLRNCGYGLRAVAPELCAALERESTGALQCERLRDDVPWRRIPDAAWPWHQGRPVIDVAQAIA